MTKAKIAPQSGAMKLKRMVRTQLGALCYRIQGGELEFLLVTSRGSGRWVIPKGWPMRGQTPGAAALQEAWEEAGVIGKLSGDAVGIYSYTKRNDPDRLPRIVAVFPIRVKRLARLFPERSERRRKWMSAEKAAARIEEPELRQILLSFEPERISSDL